MHHQHHTLSRQTFTDRLETSAFAKFQARKMISLFICEKVERYCICNVLQ